MKTSCVAHASSSSWCDVERGGQVHWRFADQIGADPEPRRRSPRMLPSSGCSSLSRRAWSCVAASGGTTENPSPVPSTAVIVNGREARKTNRPCLPADETTSPIVKTEGAALISPRTTSGHHDGDARCLAIVGEQTDLIPERTGGSIRLDPHGQRVTDRPLGVARVSTSWRREDATGRDHPLEPPAHGPDPVDREHLEGVWPFITVPKSIEPGLRTMSARMLELTPNRTSASRPLAVTSVTKRIVDLIPRKLRVSIWASMPALAPGLTVDVLALPLVQPHDGRRLRIVTGSASRLISTKSCLTLAPRARARSRGLARKHRIGPSRRSYCSRSQCQDNKPTNHASNRAPSHHRLLRSSLNSSKRHGVDPSTWSSIGQIVPGASLAR